MASFGVYPCYAGLAFVAGGILQTTLRRKELPTWGKIICYVVSACTYAASVFLAARELPSTNGFSNEKLTILSYAIAAVVFAGAYVGGFLVCRKGDAKQLWFILFAMGFIAIFLLPGGYFIKLVIHRPRFRLFKQDAEIPFLNWWETYDYKTFLANHPDHVYENGLILTKEEFKSFPSGHAGTGIIMAMFLPFMAYFFPKLKGKEVMLFYIGFGYGLLMMFSRLLCGAHYLSDTCMGALLVAIAYYIINEIAYRMGLFNDPKHQEVEQE